jgi:regulator of protease activity HflC (stomatin/prohibitin superfamily)
MSCCWICVEQSDVAIVEDCGKYKTSAKAGCHFLTPCKESVAGVVSLRVQDHHCTVESKTKDNVFVNVKLSIQYTVLPNAVEKAFYTLQNPVMQIESYIFNSIRGQIPQFDIDELFSMRSEIAERLKQDVDNQMDKYGFDILTVLITDIDPAKSVRDAMNQIQVYQRMRSAVTDKAEAQKAATIKAAEADAEAKRLSGVGLAEQRKAIVGGLQSSIEHFQEGVQELSSEDVMSLLLLNQYFDTLKDIASASSGSTLFLSHNGGLEQVAAQMTQGIIKRR